MCIALDEFPTDLFSSFERNCISMLVRTVSTTAILSVITSLISVFCGVHSSVRCIAQDTTTPASPVTRIVPLSDAPPYAPEQPISGSIELVGSTLMQPIAALWMDEFAKIHPELKRVIDCQGSEESFKKLEASPAVLGLLSREVTSEELAAINKDNQRKYVAINVGYDAIAIIVHPSNPVRALAWDAQSGSPLSISGDKTVSTWADLGVDGDLAAKPLNYILITPSHGLRSVSESVLALAKNSSATKTEKQNQLEIIEAVAADPTAIAVVSAQRVPKDSVRALPIALDASRVISPSNPQAVDAGYPLLRKLSIVARLEDSGKLAPQVDEFLRFVLSRQGQDTLIQDGLIPLDRSDVFAQQELLGWEVLK